MNNRRQFLQQASALTAGGILVSSLDNQALAYIKKRVAFADQVNIGAIGINGMGWSNVSAALSVPGVNIVALCDVDKSVLDKRMADLAKLKVDTTKVRTYNDYRQLLEQK